MDKTDTAGIFPTSMRAAPLAVAFREVRHFKPDDWLHCEPLALRAETLGWTIPAHRHEALHQIQFLRRGRAAVTLDGVAADLVAPALLMVTPGCVHAFRFDGAAEGLQVTVPSARLDRALADVPLLRERLSQTQMLQGPAVSEGLPQLQALWDALQQEFDTVAPGRHEALQAHLVLLATWLLRRVLPDAAQAQRHAQRDTLVQRFRALIELHLRQHAALGFYAQRLKVTPDHLSRACRAVTGQSALDLLHERMLVEAQRLLAYTDGSVAAVAADLGFEDAAYFSRFFSRRAGRAPAAWRTALLAGEVVAPSSRAPSTPNGD